MIKFENTKVFNFEGAIKGMRNPLESWNKSDSHTMMMHCHKGGISIPYNWAEPLFVFGENDLSLAQKLIKAGTDHSKFIRQIVVSVDITAPDYLFKEFDTYKVGTVANSTSTMHKIMSKEFTKGMFSMEDVVEISEEYNIPVSDMLINLLNNYRNEYLKTKDKRVWKALIQVLPMSFNYTRTCTLNYEVVKNMYFARNNHKLDEWSVGFVNWAESLPYFKELFLQDKNKKEKGK